jgi:hypothetical protein
MSLRDFVGATKWQLWGGQRTLPGRLSNDAFAPLALLIATNKVAAPNPLVPSDVRPRRQIPDVSYRSVVPSTSTYDAPRIC